MIVPSPAAQVLSCGGNSHLRSQQMVLMCHICCIPPPAARCSPLPVTMRSVVSVVFYPGGLGTELRPSNSLQYLMVEKVPARKGRTSPACSYRKMFLFYHKTGAPGDKSFQGDQGKSFSTYSTGCKHWRSTRIFPTAVIIPATFCPPMCVWPAFIVYMG